MSVWRISKVDAQTRALAEAAAKAAGLPLGVWLERAIMRRVENRVAAGPVLPPLTPEPTPEAVPAEKVSPEMQAALAAAERRRRERLGEEPASDSLPAARREDPAIDDADPFAAPEKGSDERPFEQSPIVDGGDPAMAPLAIADDEPVLPVDDEEKSEPVSDVFQPPVEPQPLSAVTSDPSEHPVGEAPPAPFGEDRTDVTTTPRQVMRPKVAQAAPPFAHSSLMYIAAGLVLIVLSGGAAYYFLTQPAEPEAKASVTAPAASPAQASASPPTPAPTPSQTADVKPAPPAQPSSGSPTATPPAPTPQPPPVPEVQPRLVGPSIANLAAVESAPATPSTATVPSTAAAPTPPAAARPPLANETLPALRSRAEANDLEAQVELGRRYIQGVGVGRNDAEAAKWLLRAATQGDAQAQFNVAVMYERGVGLEVSLPKAMEYYRKSAAQNTPMALHNLALLYTGDQPGLKADPAQARRLMTQAAELGQPESQYSLALMYLQGVGGPTDRAIAMSWMALAARPNQPQLIEAATQLAAQLNEGERQRARQLAEGHVKRIQANLQRLRATGAQPAAATPAAPTPEKPRVIDRTAIMEIQKLLTGLKLYGGTADGAMGPRTAAAIKEFQAMSGMTVDGKPSVELLENLREVAGLTRQ